LKLSERIVRDLRSTYDGRAWHGTPVRRMVDGVDDARANAHPIDGARSIAELLAHLVAWMEIVERRLRDEAWEVTEEEDFPSVDGVAFDAIVARMERAHAALIATVEQLSDEELDRKVPDGRYTKDFMLRGLIHHTTYHAAQTAMLKKFG
jgi:uncharacterized damage-inducible protein DinB